MNRYARNMQTLTTEENESLRNKKIAVIGCGGLGGYIIEMMGRIGIGTITAVDGDIFEETNLNRQILSDMNSLGKNKASQAFERMKNVNPEIRIIPWTQNFTIENAKEILNGCDLAMDALDNIDSRLLLEDECEKRGIPLIHGAISGWYGQVSTVLPGDKTLAKIYANIEGRDISNNLGNPSFTPALVAAYQVSEGIKILIHRGELLSKKILFINLYDISTELVSI
ncbi:MAG: HesA/MoeB/ThiF family protein [Proteocatella sp.]